MRLLNFRGRKHVLLNCRIFEFSRLGLATLLVALALPSGPAFAAELSRTDVEAIIKEYLHENPEIILESVEAYRQKQEKLAESEAEKSVVKHMAYLTSADAPSAGNPKADVVVVEFFDYNCGYCKRALPDLQTLLKDDKNLRVVFREMPILSEASMLTAQWSLAAHKQGKYFKFHQALMNHNGAKSEAELEKLAKESGLDVAAMKKDAASEETAKAIEKDLEVAGEIGIRGTPAFIVNGTVYRGYLGPEGLKGAVDAAREKGDSKPG
jgi:protein-disulfide isomerase